MTTHQLLEMPTSHVAIASGGDVRAVPQHENRPASDIHVATAKILIVDDEQINIKVVRRLLQLQGYEKFFTTTDPRNVMEIVLDDDPDVILLDIMMPEVSGLDVLRQIRDEPRSAHTPVIILTASNDSDTKQQALQRGATDFLAKPVDASELIPRVYNALTVKIHHDHLQRHAASLQREVRRRTAELVASRIDIVHCLGRAAEYRDNETGRHVIRVSRYVGIISRRMGIDEETVELMELASTLHDTGKIGIPDAVLLKPGKLTEGEFEVMKGHCSLGKNILETQPVDQPPYVLARTSPKASDATASLLLPLAATIALTHHERWDGTGYPLGVEGEEIPLEGRITAVADVYDALSSTRPYKRAFPLPKCLTIMEEGRGTHFDPNVVDAFFAGIEEIVKIRNEWADTA